MECCNCSSPLGEEAKELPMFVDSEVWCPQCFVWLRAPKEPERFAGGAFDAIKCVKCEVKSVDCGHGVCNQCGWRGKISLPAKAPKT